MSVPILRSPMEVRMIIADRVKRLRLQKNLSREGLAKKSGVPASTIKLFETTGKISFVSLVALSFALGRHGDFEELFKIDDMPKSLFDKEPKLRKRGQKK